MGQKELLNLPILVLKARHKWLCLLHWYNNIYSCTFTLLGTGMASPRLGLVLEDDPFELSCVSTMYMYMYMNVNGIKFYH